MMRSSRMVAALLAGAVAVAVPACSVPVAGSAGPDGSVTVVASTPAPRPDAPTPAADPGDGLDAAADGLRPFLLTAAEVGPGYTPGEDPTPDPATPAICGGPGIVAQFPIAVRAGVAFDGPSPGLLVQQTVSVYGDSDTAQVAYQAGRDGLSCSEGTVAGDPVVVTPAEDLRADVGGRQATGWRIGGGAFDAVLVAVQSDEHVMIFTFISPAGDPAGLPDVLAVSRTGLQKFGG